MPHLSHVTRGQISKARESRIDNVLRPFGACVVTYSGPEKDPRVWIEGPDTNRNRANERDMQAALEAAGLWPLVPAGA